MLGGKVIMNSELGETWKAAILTYLWEKFDIQTDGLE